MKNSSIYVRQGIYTALNGNIEYNSTTIPVVRYSEERNYIIIAGIDVLNESAKTSSITEASVTIDVVTKFVGGNSSHVPAETILDEINKQLTNNVLTINGFTYGMFFQNSRTLEEEDDTELIVRGIARYIIKLQQT